MTKLEHALEALARGWAVIPLWPKSKRAMHAWTEYQRRLPTVAEVMDWWAAEPEANIGILTGSVSGIVVGDVDPRNGGSVAQMQAEAPSGWVVTTPGGGAHFYYTHPGKRTPKATPRPGIDLQADGCYVVGPGSYVVTERYEGEYHQLATGVPSSAPTWLLADPRPEPSSPEGPHWITQTLRRGCPKGTRNDTLARLAGFFAGKGIEEDIVGSFLVPWVMGQKDTGVTPDEAFRTIQSVYAKERRAAEPGRFVVDRFLQKKEAEGEEFDIEGLVEFVNRYYAEKTSWLIPEWLPDKTIAFLVSPPGRFKTMLTFDVAVSVACGYPFLGKYPVQRPGPVLVIQQEDDYTDMARRFNRIYASRVPEAVVTTEPGMFGAIIPSAPPIHIVKDRGFSLNEASLHKLERAIQGIRPRVVIIDPLYSITPSDDYMAQAAHDMMPFKSLRDEYGVSFLLAAHTKKGAAEGREGLWGSQFLNAFLETGWQIRDRPEGEPNQVQLDRHFKAAGSFPRLNLEFFLDENEGYRVDAADAEAEDGEVPSDPVLEALGVAGEAGLTAAEVAERTGSTKHGAQQKLIARQKKGLVTAWPKTRGKETVWKLPKDTTSGLEGK